MYLAPQLLSESSDTPACAGTVLHTRMYLAVSAGLNRIVSVRNTVVTHDGRYPLRLSRMRLRVYARQCVRTFLTILLSRIYPTKNRVSIVRLLTKVNIKCIIGGAHSGDPNWGALRLQRTRGFAPAKPFLFILLTKLSTQDRDRTFLPGRTQVRARTLHPEC